MSIKENHTANATTGDRRRINALKDLDLPRYVLLPGDPDRVNLMASQWTDAQVVELSRGYRAAVGTYDGVRIGAVSTMIGAPSLDNVFADLARLGTDTFIRVGTCGTIREEIATGSLIINDASVRLDGTTHFYVRNEYPAAASFEVTFALADAAASKNYQYRIGTGVTSGSFFAGQGRPGINGYMSLQGEQIFEEMRRAGALNFEMETAALLTLSRLFNFRAGSICSVIANRMTGAWNDDGGIERACRVAADALVRLTKWDAKTAESGRTTLTAASIRASE